MNLLPLRILLALASVLVCHAWALASHVTVRGNISNVACKLDIGFKDHYPRIHSSQLNAGRPTVLASKEDDFTITCPDLAKVGLSFKDNFAGSKVPNLMAGKVQADFGLALHRNYKVGALALQVIDAKGDSQPLSSFNAVGGRWQDDRGTVLASTIVAWSRDSTAGKFTPGKFRQITAKLRITPVIVRREDLPRNDQIGVEARLTSELHYL